MSLQQFIQIGLDQCGYALAGHLVTGKDKIQRFPVPGFVRMRASESVVTDRSSG